MSSICSKKAALHNLGCKVNAYETQVMEQQLREAGSQIVPFDEKADIYIVNTCSVTNIADRKSRQMLHRARALNPGAVIVAAGCYVQGRGEGEVLSDGVDIVVGNSEKADIVKVLEDYFEKGERAAVSDILSSREYPCGPLLQNTGDRIRAFIKAEDGCDRFCSYCIIPYVRGRVRSRSVGDVLKEAQALAMAGYKEVVLTGINLNEYGKDTKEADLTTLTEMLCEVEGLKRIRLSSVEPGVLTEDFVRRMAAREKVCPHFHLSLQSGCDRTLERMNRHYTSGEFYESAERLREAFYRERGAYPALTADVIVGFPGETEEDFEECRAFLEKMRFFETHIFKYSIRKGTAAAAMDGQLTDRVKSERSAVLQELNERNRDRFIREIMDNTAYVPELLVEETVTLDGKLWSAGHTGEYLYCALEGEVPAGTIVRGRPEGLIDRKNEAIRFCRS